MVNGPTDPRATVTPDSFVVAPELLGLPLARPWRRLAAMLIDLLLVAILANAGGVFLAFAAAIALWRASSPTQRGGAVKSGVRGSLRLGAALFLFVAILNVTGRIRDRFDDDSGVRVETNADGGVPVDLGLGDLARWPDLIALESATDTAEVRAAARAIATRIEEMQPDARSEFAELLNGVDDDVARDILDAAIGVAPPASAEDVANADSAVLRYADALTRADSADIARLRRPALVALGRDSLERLEQRNSRLRRANSELETRVNDLEDRGSGFMGFLRGIADDLGIGFGWGALYFSAFLALWRGQTPGKRALGVRVIRLDGRPISWWIAFERFGGYAASLSTGLLGFAQLLWDRNRQGLHDKAVETVVIRDLPASLASSGTWRPADHSS